LSSVLSLVQHVLVLHSVFGGIASFFARKKEDERKKKKRGRVSDKHDVDQDPASPVTPPPRATRPRRDSETKSTLSAVVFKTMPPEAKAAVMLSLWEDAYTAAGRKYLHEEERMELVRRVAVRCDLPDLTFDSLRKSISRIQEKEDVRREPGSGRPRKFTEAHANAAREVARAFGGELSRSGIYEVVAERFGQQMSTDVPSS
jgi:hypothetical protein